MSQRAWLVLLAVVGVALASGMPLVLLKEYNGV